MQESFHAIPEFREFGRLNIINQFGILQQRMLSMLQKTAEQRYGDLGITDTSLSRIRKEFIKKQPTPFLAIC